MKICRKYLKIGWVSKISLVTFLSKTRTRHVCKHTPSTSLLMSFGFLCSYVHIYFSFVQRLWTRPSLHVVDRWMAVHCLLIDFFFLCIISSTPLTGTEFVTMLPIAWKVIKARQHLNHLKVSMITFPWLTISWKEM